MVSEQEKLEGYLTVLNEQLDCRKRTEDLVRLKELFETGDFLEILRTQRLDIALDKERKKKSNNKAVVKYLTGALEEHLQGEDKDNENMEYLYFYFRSKAVKKVNRRLIWVMLGVFLASIAICACSEWYRVDALLIKKAPTTEEVVQELEKQYGVEASAEEIEVGCRFNTNDDTSKKYPKMVAYTVPVTIDNAQMELTATWVPHEELEFDYVGQYIQHCLTENAIEVSEYEDVGNWKIKFTLNAVINDENDKEQFKQHFIQAIQKAYEDEWVKDKDFSFMFGLEMNGRTKYFSTLVYGSEVEENLEEFSYILDEEFLESLAYHLWFD